MRTRSKVHTMRTYLSSYICSVLYSPHKLSDLQHLKNDSCIANRQYLNKEPVHIGTLIQDWNHSFP